MEVNEVIKLKIDSVTYEGNGSGSYDGETVFVPFTAPGDFVEARVKRIGDYADAELIRILEKSKSRTEANCPYFSACGSCDFLHMSYESQLEEKRKIIEYVFRKNRINFSNVEKVAESPRNFNYRARTKFNGEIDRNLFLGFKKRKSHKLIDVAECPLLSDGINKIFLNFRRHLEEKLRHFKKENQHTDAQNFEVEICQSGKVFYFVLNISGKNIDFFREIMNNFVNKNLDVSGYCLKNMVGKELYKSSSISFSYGISSLNFERNYRFSYDENCFTQVNFGVNELIINKIQEIVKEFAGRNAKSENLYAGRKIKILDLYSGIGNIGISVSGFAEKVLCVEENPSSAKSGAGNASANGAQNVEFLNTSSENSVKDILRKNEKFDIVILDPPRRGLEGLAKEIPKINPKKIIYVSCDARSLSKDAKQIQDSGYRIKKILPFDMFPQTSHVEILVEMER